MKRAAWMMVILLAGCGSEGGATGGMGGVGGTNATMTGTGGVATDGGATEAGQDAPSSCSASFPPCLSGHITGCHDAGAISSACCNGETPIPTCSLPAGMLTDDCKDYLGAPCASGVCAVSLGGKVTCCGMVNGMPDPCATPQK